MSNSQLEQVIFRLAELEEQRRERLAAALLISLGMKQAFAPKTPMRPSNGK